MPSTHNIINVHSSDPLSVKNAIDRVKNLFKQSIQSVVVVESFRDYEGELKTNTEKFTNLGCPHADLINNYYERGFASVFEEAKEKYYNIVVIKP